MRRYGCAAVGRAAVIGMIAALGSSPLIGSPAAAQTVAGPAPTFDTIAVHVTEAAQRFGIPEAWIYAVMRVESAGDISATSVKGAMGLMQVMPATYTALRSRYGFGPDLPIEAQITARGATWLDRQLVAREAAATGAGFGAEVRAAMDARIDHLAGERLASRQGQAVIFSRDLLDTLSRRELAEATRSIADRTGLQHRPSSSGEYVTGAYRQRITLASGRFAMIDDGTGFQLVPWRPALEQHIGQHVTGTAMPGGGVDWTFGRQRGPAI